MLVRTATWDKIRDQFTEEEKNRLRMAKASDCLCPPGAFIKSETLNLSLLAKLTKAIKTVEKV